MDRFIQGVRFLRRSRKLHTIGIRIACDRYQSDSFEREGGKWTKCLVLSKIVQQHRLSSLYPRRRLCIEYRWTLSRRGNISKVGGESFEKIISINCHFTTASFKRVDRSYIQRYQNLVIDIDLYFSRSSIARVILSSVPSSRYTNTKDKSIVTSEKKNPEMIK